MIGATLAATGPAGAFTPLAPSLEPLALQVQQINSGNVAVVAYNGGKFIKIGAQDWVEQTDTGVEFHFVETGYDETAVYLRDDSRNVQIALDVSLNVILYAEGTGEFSKLYDITFAEMAEIGAPPPPPGGGHVVSYSCNEGIPLIVRLEERGPSSFAFVSHDSFPEIRLEQVPSGSGSRYVGAGYELHTKGDDAVFQFNGSEDHCRRD